MQSTPLVSIVTPSYNQAQFLERTILSVISQDYPCIEYIVMDGGSTDGSVNILEKYSQKITFWVSEKDKGQSDAINKGWRMAKGEYCCYLNSDDMLAPSAISKIVSTFEKNPNAGVVYGDYTFVDANDRVLEKCKGAPTNFRKLLIDGQIKYIAQPSSFYRAHLVRQINYIDESFHLAMDYDLLVKLAEVSQMVYIPETLSLFRLHVATKSSTLAKRHWHETLRVKAKYNKLLMAKSIILYIRFRLFHLLPDFIKTKLRRRRFSVHDQILLNTKS